MIYCTFAGHRDILHTGIERRVTEILNEILDQDTEFCFYVGGMGEFDMLCARVVWQAKRQFVDKRISLILVEPYMKQSINRDGSFLYDLYDEIIIPDSISGVHFKRAILLRNRWMADQSQYMISYVFRDFGGAYDMLCYAEKKGLKIYSSLE